MIFYDVVGGGNKSYFVTIGEGSVQMFQNLHNLFMNDPLESTL